MRSVLRTVESSACAAPAPNALIRVWTATASVIALCASTLAHAQTLPSGGSVAAGAAAIASPSARTLNINQTTNQAIVNWQSFSVGQGGTVNFNQPSASSAILNRVTGATPSSIAGTINAAGTVLLVNPNGIAITSSGVVNTGSFAASTLDIKNDDFLAGKYKFTGNGSSAVVTNAGRINVSDGGFAALLGGRVANDGIITARLGKVGLGSGEMITLDMSGDGFLSVAVPSNQLGNLRDGTGQALVTNRGKIRADGGTVYLSAATATNILRDAINVPGSIRANSVGTRNGRIVIGGGTGGRVNISGRLYASGAPKRLANRATAGKGGQIDISGADIALTGAQVNVSGATGGGTVRIGGDALGKGDFQHAQSVTIDSATTIRADATENGNGGNITVWSDGHTAAIGEFSARGGAFGGNGGVVETSGHTVDFSGVRVDASAPQGKSGEWLIDPVDLTVDAAAAATIASNLATANVTLLTTSTSASGPGVQTAGNGDIFVNSAISWTSANALTLSSYRDIRINASITGGAGSSVTLRADNTGTGVGTVAFDSAATKITATGGVAITYNPTSYTTPTNFAPNAGTGTTISSYFLVNTLDQLQSIPSSGNYVLTRDIDASATSGWNGGAGFAPITFSGYFNGQGFTIWNLTVNRPADGNIGLFATNSGTISNINLSGGTIRGGGQTGGLVGLNNGTIVGSSTNLSVFGGNGYTGGLVGINRRIIDTSYASGPVSGGTTGGLVGYNDGYSIGNGTIAQITQSFATGSVYGVGYVGGLVGYNDALGSLNRIGYIADSFATGAVTGGINTSLVGGLVGYNWGNIYNSFAAGGVSGGQFAGGVIGRNIGTLNPGCMSNSCSLRAGIVQNTYWNTGAFGGAGIGSFSNPANGIPGANIIVQTTGLSRGQLQAGLQSGFSTGIWAILPGLSYPFHKAIFPNGPLIVSGYAAIDNGPQPYRSQNLVVNVDGYSTWASSGWDGYYYTLINKPSAGQHQVIVNTLGDYGGVRYDQAWTGQITGFDVWGGYVRARTSDTTLSAMANTISAALTNAGATKNSIDDYRSLEISSTATNFLLDRSLDVNGLVVGSAGMVTSPTAYGLSANMFSISSGAFYRVAGGSGTGVDPYLITDVYGLQGIGSSLALLSAHYSIINNIDASSTANWNNGAGFVPIGTLGTFTGSLRGSSDAWNNGTPTTISFLNIYRPSSDYVGLFSKISSIAGVTYLSFLMPTITGNNYVGTIAGNNGGSVSRVDVTQGTIRGASYVGGLSGVAQFSGTLLSMYAGYFSGSVRGTGDYVGGLVGSTNQNIFASSSSGTVRGNNYVGGLVGMVNTGINAQSNTQIISNSYSTSDVTGNGYVGGLIGSNGLYSAHTLGNRVQNSFATGNVVGAASPVGGLIGYNAGTVSQSYATGNVTVWESLTGIGGLIGYNVNSVTQSYATGNVTATSGGMAGGLVGQQGASGVGDVVSGASAGLTLSYATGNTYGSMSGGLIGILQLANPNGISQNWSSGRSTRDGTTGGGFLGLNAGYTSSLASNYWDTESSGLTNPWVQSVITTVAAPVGLTTAQALNPASYSGWNFSNDWMTLGTSRPFLRSEFSMIAGLDGALQIGSAHQLAYIGLNTQTLFGNYRLVSDIRANEFTNAGMFGSAGWRPIGIADPNNRFLGTFNGDGHVIDGLRINLPNSDNVGLFGFVNSTATITNLGITNASVLGHLNVGILAGSNVGTIQATYATGTAAGYDNIGGLVGYNIGNDVQNGGGWGTIRQSYSNATVSYNSWDGNPKPFFSYGLLVGRNGDDGGHDALISDSYTLGGITTNVGISTTGAIAGTNYGIIQTSYATGGNGMANAHGLVGNPMAGGSVSASYYDGNKISVSSWSEGTARTTAQMYDLDNMWTNYAGFDFTSIWAPPNQVGQGGGITTAHLPGLYALEHVIFVNLAGASMTYGDAQPNFGGSVSGLRENDAATPVSLVRDLGYGWNVNSTTAAGSAFSVSAGGGRATSLDGSDYRFVYVNATGTVARRAITVTANNQTAVYGGSDPALTYQVTSGNLVNNDQLSGGLTRGAGSNVGSYGINQGSLAANSNYTLTYVGGTFSITPATLTYTADAANRPYGDSNSVFSGTVTGFVNGDTLTSATTGTLAFGSTASATSSVGHYAINGSGLSANFGNYIFQQAASNTTALSIDRRAVTVTANAQNRTYGDANPALTYTTSSLGAGVAVTGALTVGADANSGVGLYAIGQGTVSNATNANYDITYVDANLTINPAMLVFTANTASRTYGAMNPALSGQVSGFRNGETALTFGGDVWSTSVDAGTGVGHYAITGGFTNASPNYTITQAAANATAFTINPADIVVTANGGTSVYGASPTNPGLSATGLQNGEDVGVLAGLSNSFGITATSGVAGNPYTLSVAGTLTNPNYRVMSLNTGIWTVTPAQVMVTANGGTSVYGASPTNPGLSATGLQNGEDAGVLAGLANSFGITSTSGVAGGPYTLSVTGTLTNPNYQIASLHTGVWTVTPAPVVVTANGGTSIYGSSPTNPGLSAAGLQNGEGIGVLTGLSNDFGIAPTTGVAGGPYTLNVIGALTNPNYQVASLNSGTWTITPAQVAITANGGTSVYGASSTSPGLSATGLQNGEGVGVLTGLFNSFGITATSGVAGGPYTLSVAGMLTNPNYQVASLNTGIWTVTPAPVVVTANGGISIYGSSPSNPGLSAAGLQNGEGVDVLTGLANSFGITQASGVAGNPYRLSVVGLLTNPNYQVTSRNFGIWSVTPASITVTADPQSRLFSETDPALTYRITAGRLFNGDQFSGALARGAGSAVGIYPINQGALAASSNYTLAFVGSTFEIKALPFDPSSQLAPPTAATIGLSGGPPVNPTTISFQSDVGSPVPGIEGSGSGSGSAGARDRESAMPGALVAAVQPTDPAVTASIGKPADIAQAIAAANGLVFRPISQYDAREYAGGVLPGFEARAGQATVLTMIARAIARGDADRIFIDAFWNPVAADNIGAVDPARIAQRVSFSNGNGKAVDPAVADAFRLTAEANLDGLLKNGPVMIGGQPHQDGTQAWMLAIKLSDDGKGIVANDPASGRQVILAYDSETRIVGGVTRVFDPKSNAWIAVADAEAVRTAGINDIAPGGVTALQSFVPTNYLAVVIN
jgi:filamentous hemagglutinin family protein